MKKVSKYSYTWFISFIIELRSSRRKLYRDEILFFSSFICFTCFTYFTFFRFNRQISPTLKTNMSDSMNEFLQLCKQTCLIQ